MGKDKSINYQDPEVKEFLDDASDFFEEEDRKSLEEEQRGRDFEIVRDLNFQI